MTCGLGNDHKELLDLHEEINSHDLMILNDMQIPPGVACLARSPVKPEAPVNPVRPVAPESPVSPVAPIKPVEPVRPVTPACLQC